MTIHSTGAVLAIELDNAKIITFATPSAYVSNRENINGSSLFYT